MGTLRRPKLKFQGVPKTQSNLVLWNVKIGQALGLLTTCTFQDLHINKREVG